MAAIKEAIQLATISSYGTNGEIDGTELLKNLNNIDGIRAAAPLVNGKLSYPVSIATKKSIFQINNNNGDLTELIPGLYYADSNEQILTWDELYDGSIGNMMLNPSDRTKLARANFNLDNVQDKNGNTVGNGNGNVKLIVDKSITSVGSMGGLSSLGEVILPPTVTSVEGGAFGGCSYLKSAIVPSGDLGASAFPNLGNLETVILGNGVTSIGSSAFGYSNKITSIEIPDSVTSISSACFVGCTSLANVTISNSVTSIGASAFASCTALTNVTIPENVTSIGSGAFGGCNNITHLSILGKADGLAYNTFSASIDSLKSVVLGSDNVDNGLATIPNQFCYGADNLEKITIKGSMTSIAEASFMNCPKLTSVNIANGVTSIETAAFRECTKLTSLTIPNSVTSIGNAVFYGCTSLTSLIIPESVTTLGSGALDGCSSLSELTIKGKIADFVALSRSSNPTGSENANANSLCNNTNLKKITLGSDNLELGLTVIPYRALQGFQYVESITINPSVTSVEDYAFVACSNLKNIIIKNGSSNLTVNYFAFSYTDLTDVYYAGSSDNWNEYLDIDNTSSGNQKLLDATKHWNS